MAMQLVTGYAGGAHVTAIQDAIFNRGLYGSAPCIIKYGQNMTATKVSNTVVTIGSGACILQGRFFISDDTETFTLATPASENGRIYLIGVTYACDSSTRIETIEWDVISGTQTSGTPVDPSYTEMDMMTHTDGFEPLFRCTISTSHVLTIESIATYYQSIPEQLAGYLPLAGGTMTGALNGTSAKFSSLNVTGASTLAGGWKKAGTNNVGYIWRYTGSGTFASSSSFTQAVSKTLDAGTWVITLAIQFAANATGFRTVYIYEGVPSSASINYCARQPAVSSGVSMVEHSTIINLDGSTQLSFGGQQNSGSSLAFSIDVRAVKIA